MNSVFAGGGSGGHVYPAIAIADALRKRTNEIIFPEITFIGTQDRLESTIVPAAGYRFLPIFAKPFLGAGLLARIGSAYSNGIGILQSVELLRRIFPDIVIATGGYVCFPVVIAARILRRWGSLKAPIALLEPNAQSGLTNRILAPLVDEIWCAYEPSSLDVPPKVAEKLVYTGVPMRSSFRNIHAIVKEDARKKLGLDPHRPVLLVMGGSQGARSINTAIVKVVSQYMMPYDWQVLLIAGTRDFKYVTELVHVASARAGDSVRQTIQVFDYLDDMPDAYAASDLVLARAGASTLAEVAAAGIPSILVPLPVVSKDHQDTNARIFAQSGAAVVLKDAELDEALADVLHEITTPERLSAMRAASRPDAGEAVDRILARIDDLLSRKPA